jgi:hypothetical protein
MIASAAALVYMAAEIKAFLTGVKKGNSMT